MLVLVKGSTHKRPSEHFTVRCSGLSHAAQVWELHLDFATVGRDLGNLYCSMTSNVAIFRALVSTLSLFYCLPNGVYNLLIGQSFPISDKRPEKNLCPRKETSKTGSILDCMCYIPCRLKGFLESQKPPALMTIDAGKRAMDSRSCLFESVDVLSFCTFPSFSQESLTAALPTGTLQNRGHF